MAAFIASQREQHGIPHASACRALGVSQSWFYKWIAGPLPPRVARREGLKVQISRLFDRHKGTYGAPGSLRICVRRALERVGKGRGVSACLM